MVTDAVDRLAPRFLDRDLAVMNLRVNVTGSLTTVSDRGRPTVMEVRYRDIPDDGRYLLIVDSPGAALPVDATTFAKTLNRVVNTIRARHSARINAVT